MKYADIIIDNKSNSTDTPFTYGFDDGMDVKVGSKVYVPFARSRNLRSGYVIALRDEVDDDLKKRIRLIDSVDEEIALTEEIMRTCDWMRRRYVCRYIDAIECFIPVGKKPTRAISPDPAKEDEEESKVSELTEEQKNALEQIEGAVDDHRHERFLIRGVTGSGKTEVYIRTAKKVIEKGRSVIILVPEISLTPQIISRFNGVFGPERIAVLHSRLTRAQRYDQWKKIQEGRIDIVIGARSAVFAPLEDIGLIVIDEEHESTYKSDFTPKYDAIEVAIKRAVDEDHSAILVLGSATPSVASYYRGQQGIYRILTMEKRYNQTPLPEVETVDMRDELREGNSSILSRRLVEEMGGSLEEGRQVLLFLNRRGYSTFISCRECGYVASCPICGLSMTYHSTKGRLSCHYCGHEEPLPKVCPECGSRYIRHFGSGTEKVEEEISRFFPDRVIDRIDLDSIQKRGELNRRLKQFEKGKTDILVGTQIIAKGLDFRNIGLVGVISADVSLNIPDYRSSERTFQLITQAAGRSGRGREVGRVVIQTYNPDHYAIRLAADQDYEGFYRQEVAFRELMRYPPFSDMIQVLFTSKDPEISERGACRWYDEIRRQIPANERKDVFNPQEAYMSRVRDVYRYSLVIRSGPGQRQRYAQIMRGLKEQDAKARAPWVSVVDINPYSFA